ncbi:hypothetical protein SKAU_G00138520 [Synaphobranchus kaupii]|uniref:Uncharacterized protein n=1 Tax=Synaphobranchus kaupii TaxID=118154 RepID=A0A9Q1FRT3_SYNKA|nr:hypothetical protein SKAU_G00138520 [Synaphobranchus kaupii]
MDPYIDGLLESLERRFQNLDLLGAFHVPSPQAVTGDEAVNVANLQLLAGKFLQRNNKVLQEWSSFKQQMLVGAFKDMDQQHLMQGLASKVGEWGQLYPSLSKLAAS